MAANTAETPFGNLKINDFQILQDLKRSKCPKCKAKRMYFCYTCYRFVEDIDENAMPKIKLPVSCDIVKHPKELDGKSTAVHAALLAPEDVHIYTYPVIPDYSKNEDVLLVFPGPDSHPLQHYSKQKTEARKRPLDPACENGSSESPPAKERRVGDDCGVRQDDNELKDDKKAVSPNKQPTVEPTFKKIVLIDSTWNQVHQISSDKRLKGVKCVELTEQSTNYWRRQQNRPESHLATIEAVHSFYKQYHQMFIGEYEGQYDNLLYFFVFFYHMVHKNKSSR